MSVTRVEGARPLEATTTAAKQQPRPSNEHAKKHGVPQSTTPVDEKLKAEPNFQPYSLSFRFDEELNRVVVKVIDQKTGELLREIPPAGVIEALKKLRQTPGGLVDEEA